MTVRSEWGRGTGGQAIVKRCSHRGLWQHMRLLADRQSVRDISPVTEPRFARQQKKAFKIGRDSGKSTGETSHGGTNHSSRKMEANTCIEDRRQKMFPQNPSWTFPSMRTDGLADHRHLPCFIDRCPT